MSREQSFNIIRTVVSMGVAIAVAFIIILLVSDQPVESIRIFLLAPLSSKRYLGNIVEMGETDTIIHHPLHPYTQALISNCASIDLDEKREPIRIEGEPPSPVDPKPCCPFAGRCFCEQEICRREKPQLRHMADGRVVACHLVKEK